MSLSNVFVVVSWGRTGTVWLAKLLNAHPQVFCLHHLPASMQSVLGPAAVPSEVDYLRLVVDQAGAHYRLVGDCHGVRVQRIHLLQDAFGDRLRVCSVTRHPVPRLESYLLYAQQIGVASYGIDYVRVSAGIPEHLRALAEGEERMFFAYLMGLVNLIELEVEAGPVFPIERLSTNLREVNRLLAHLSDGELKFTAAAARSVMAERLNVSVGPDGTPLPPRTADPEERFMAWPSWQQELFLGLLHDRARELYEQLGLALPTGQTVSPCPPSE